MKSKRFFGYRNEIIIIKLIQYLKMIDRLFGVEVRLVSNKKDIIFITYE